MRILISAGEASGEMYGAQLIEAMRRIDPSVEFFGVGGERMRAAGCEIVLDSKDLSVVGITEILSHLPKIWQLFHQLIAEADRRKPDLAIVIDSPAFNWRVARQIKKRGIPVVYYVCPQFWAWRQGRVRLLRKYVDKALVIFPFEEKFYRDRGVNAEFVGHPLGQITRPAISREEYAAKHGMNPSKLWVTLMPGSRVKEVRMNLPGLIQSASLLGNRYEFLLPVAPTLNAEFMRALVDQAPPGSGTSNPANLPFIHLVPQALPALAHSRAGIIASGTATVEAALMNLPFVMVYRVTPLTYLLGRSTVRVPHFAMVNLIAGRQVVPELVQEDFTPEKITAEIEKIIPESDARKKMLTGLKEVRDGLRGDEKNALPPAERAANTVFELLRASHAGQAP